MAYLNFSPLDGETRTASPEDAGRFSSTELHVIDLAERIDATRELSHETRLGRFIERVLGIRLARPLADSRLETLRRFASLARHHSGDVGEDDIRGLVEAGYSPGQAYGLLNWLGEKEHRQVHLI